MSLQPDTYSVTVVAWNPLSATNITSSVTIDSSVTAISINDNNIVTKANQVKNFFITFGSLGMTTCITIDFGDGSNVATYGSQSCVASSGIQVQPLTNPLLVNYTYVIEKTYSMIVSGRDMFGSATTTFKFTVSSADCFPPIVSIINQASLFYSPAIAYKSNAIGQSATLSISCPASLNNTKRWRVYTVDSIYGQDTSEIDISQIPSAKSSQIMLPVRFLAYGLHRFHFSVTLQVTLSSGATARFIGEAETFVQVAKYNIKFKREFLLHKPKV